MAVVLAVATLASCSTDDLQKTIEGAGEKPALPHLSIQQTDVSDEYTVTLFPNGTDAQGVPTLDLCAATYPSEALRLARRQVAVVDGEQRLLLSTEAVAYRDPDATAQAFKELREVRASCPPEFRPNDSGSQVLSTFADDLDTNWAPPPTGVERLAYDVIMVYDSGEVSRTLAVYLRRGRILLGVYFFIQPDAPIPSVQAQPTLERIVGVFSTRMTELAPAVVNP